MVGPGMERDSTHVGPGVATLTWPQGGCDLEVGLCTVAIRSVLSMGIRFERGMDWYGIPPWFHMKVGGSQPFYL